MMNVWVLTTTSCDDCGGETYVRVFDRTPTKEEISEISGTSICATTTCTEVEIGADSIKAVKV